MLYSLLRFTLLFVLAIVPWMNSAVASAQPSAAQFLQWLAYYTNNDIRADYNYDGQVSPADFSAFLVNYDNPPQPPQPTDGWTELNPGPNSKVIYVSSSLGNDNNDGLSQGRPVKTIEHAYDLLRDGQPDWIRLRRGDIWYEALPNWKKSGKSYAEPMVVSYYGESTLRPRLYTGTTRGMRAAGPEVRKHLRFVGFEVRPHLRTREDAPGGIEFICEHEDILIEDCLIAGYADNLQFQGDDVARARDIRVRRCIIVDSWAVGRHSQGLYATRVDNMFLEQNIFDHNGWKVGEEGAEPTIFNHNIYIQANCSGIQVLDNIISNASSHGVQMRSGGVVVGNFFYKNAINVLLGHEDYVTTGAVNSNVIMAGKDIGPGLPRGMGIHIQFTKDAKVRDNIILRNGTDAGQSEAIAIIGDSNDLVQNLLIERNTIYNWRNNVVIENDGLRNMTFRNNVVYDSQNESPAVRHWTTATLDDVVAYNNTYYIGGTSNWFRAFNSYYNLNQWLNVADESSPRSFSGRSFVDDSRTLVTYAQNLLLPADDDVVVNRARLMNRTTWDDNYTAKKIVTYFKEGYKLAD
ncbi:MAG: right-handed parallel beta-helix repeat-containing protein [Phycisphaerales bacterium]|nr:right-handed parallel beta-helix repeat-containing protein [Phycisphaerales bacterium]